MRAVTLFLLCALLAACGLPRDPHGTLTRVEGGQLRAGLVAGEPNLDSDRARLTTLAASLNATLEPQTGDPHDLMMKLERGDLDIIASLPKDTPFKQAGFTHPAAPKSAGDETPPVWAVRAGENAFLFRVNQFLMEEGGGS